MAMKVVALGTGVCVNGIKGMPDRQPPGILVEVDGRLVLFDCSEGVRFRIEAAGYDYGNVANVALTHAHPDHAALPQFIQSKFCRHMYGDQDENSRKLKIFMPKLLGRDFPQVWNWHQPENDGGYWQGFQPEFVGLSDGDKVELWPGATLKAYDVYHGYGRHPSMGFRLETKYGTFAYTGDSGVCEGVRVLSQSADLLIADCQVRVGQEYTGGYGHMGPRQCGDIALKGGVKRLWLTHYPGIDEPEAVLAEVRASGFFGDARLALDGDRLELK